MYGLKITRAVLMCILFPAITGQDLLSIKPEVFIEGQPGEVTCTYNNQFTTFSITGPISNIDITTCRVQLPKTCKLTTNNYSQYYSLSKTNNSVTVHINSVSRTRDGGQWKCRAFVSESVQPDGNITIDVKDGPEVSVSNVTVSIKEKENLRISCTVKSNPPTNDISWYQSNGDSVPNQLIDSSIANRRDLVFNDIYRTRSDNYTCTARLNLNPTDGNILPQTHSQSSIINVQYFDDIVITTKQTKLQENDPVSITCTVDSNPPASIKWFKDSNVELSTSNSNTYFISSASCLDTGNYSCSATNPVYTNLKTKSLELFVHCSPRLDPRVDSKLKVSGNIGETIELRADIISYPGAEFRWFYKDNGRDIIIENQEPYFIINTNRFINSYRSVLRIDITSNEMFRLYYVNVTNDDGLSSDILQFQITAETAPDIPCNIMFRNITTGTICVEWTPGFNGGASQSFIVQHSTDDKTWVNSSTIPDRTNNGRVDYCIEGLEPDTSYYIRVIARNKYGESLIGILSMSKPHKTTPGKGNSSDVSGAGIGTGIGIALAIFAIVLIAVLLYKYRQSKRKTPEQTYDNVDFRATADAQTYQELNIVPTTSNTESPQNDDAVRYYNLGPSQNATNRQVDDTRPYASLRPTAGKNATNRQVDDTTPYANLRPTV